MPLRRRQMAMPSPLDTLWRMNHVIYDGPALDQPIPQLTLPEFIRHSARQHSDKVALIDVLDGRSCSYADVDRLIGRVAAGLAAQHFMPGDTLMMFAPNLLEWPIVALGAMAAGGVVSAANPAYAASDLAHQMRDAKARFIFTVPALLDCVREAAAQSDCKILLLGDDAQALSYASLISCAPGVSPDAIARHCRNARVMITFRWGEKTPEACAMFRKPLDNSAAGQRRS